MTPVYLNPLPSSFELEGEQNDEQHLQLFLSSSHPPPSSLSCHTFFSATQDQRMTIIEESQQHDRKARTRELTTTIYYLPFFNSFPVVSFPPFTNTLLYI